MKKVWIAFLIAAFLIVASRSEGAFTVQTNAPSLIADTTAQLNGQVNNFLPILTNGPTRNAGSGSTSQSFFMDIAANATLVLFQLGGGDTCGTVSALTIGGSAAAQFPGTSKDSIVTGSIIDHVELWYKVNPPTGLGLAVAVTWTLSCAAGFTHAATGYAFTAVNTAAPLSNGVVHLQNDSGTPVTTISFTFTPPSTSQYVSLVVSDSQGNIGAGWDARMKTPVAGLEKSQWGFVDSGGSGSTFCSSINRHCVEGGIGTSGIFNSTKFFGNPVYYAASETFIQGSVSCKCSFQWGTLSTLGNWTAFQTITTGAPYSSTLTGLKPVTKYFFRAHGNDSTNANLQTNGTILNFTTVQNADVQNLINYGLFFGFFLTLAITLVGAWYVKKWRDGDL